ncbi:hypothetical protein [Micromonospora chalcea]|uniref:hypothetical protein n=1 Tax=Micromonospora chalcea TaxID=1874 RepID=UPI003B75C27F
MPELLLDVFQAAPASRARVAQVWRSTCGLIFTGIFARAGEAAQQPPHRAPVDAGAAGLGTYCTLFAASLSAAR